MPESPATLPLLQREAKDRQRSELATIQPEPADTRCAVDPLQAADFLIFPDVVLRYLVVERRWRINDGSPLIRRPDDLSGSADVAPFLADTHHRKIAEEFEALIKMRLDNP